MNQEQMISKFGNPMNTTERVQFEKKWMQVYQVPVSIKQAIICLPPKIYMNKLVVIPFQKVMETLIEKGLYVEIKTYNGCFNPRYQRGSHTRLSEHSWGSAFDFNAETNPLVRKVTPANRAELRKKYVTWSEPFLQVWRDHDFSCGADWSRSLDGMHFEYNF